MPSAISFTPRHHRDQDKEEFKLLLQYLVSFFLSLLPSPCLKLHVAWRYRVDLSFFFCSKPIKNRNLLLFVRSFLCLASVSFIYFFPTEWQKTLNFPLIRAHSLSLFDFALQPLCLTPTSPHAALCFLLFRKKKKSNGLIGAFNSVCGAGRRTVDAAVVSACC